MLCCRFRPTYDADGMGMLGIMLFTSFFIRSYVPSSGRRLFILS